MKGADMEKTRTFAFGACLFAALQGVCATTTVEELSLDADRTYEDVVTEGFAFKEDKSILDLTITRKEDGQPLGRIIITRRMMMKMKKSIAIKTQIHRKIFFPRFFSTTSFFRRSG